MLLPLEIIRIGDAPAEPLPAGDRPLSGIRAARSHPRDRGPGLRAHARRARRRRDAGDRARSWPSMESLVAGHGPRQALDLISTFAWMRTPSGCAGSPARPTSSARAIGRAPSRRTASRPSRGAAAPRHRLRHALGLRPLGAVERAPRLRQPGADGDRHRRRRAAAPWASTSRGRLPCQALDHASGYLAAFGTMVALARRATQGGSWMVRVSLAQTGRWIDRLGRVDGLATPDLKPEDVADLMEDDGHAVGQHAGGGAGGEALGHAGALDAAVGAAGHASARVARARDMREYHYRVDGDGRVFHDGSEIVDAATLRFFLLGMRREPDGRWLVPCQGEQNWFAADDTPFVMQRLRLDADDGPPARGGARSSPASFTKSSSPPRWRRKTATSMPCAPRRASRALRPARHAAARAPSGRVGGARPPPDGGARHAIADARAATGGSMPAESANATAPLSPRETAALLRACLEAIRAECAGMSERRRVLAPPAGGMVRQGSARPPHRGRPARLRRPHTPVPRRRQPRLHALGPGRVVARKRERLRAPDRGPAGGAWRRYAPTA